MRPAIGFAVALAFMPLPALGEELFFTPAGSFAVEVSLDNSPYLRLPVYRNAITSLEVAGDYAIGGTSAQRGLSPYLFAVSLSKRRLEMAYPLETLIPGQRAIRSGFGRGAGGALYAGTMPDRPGESGHIIKVQVRGGNLDVADLGSPVAGEGIFALASDPRSGAVYGISHPSGRFFVFHEKDRRTSVHEETVPSKATLRSLDAYALKPDDYLSRRLILDRSGNVYGSLPRNKLFRFDPGREKVEVLREELPAVWDRAPLGRVDSWAFAPDGAVYGGNAGDGQVFRLDPASGRLVNLGKPVMTPRIKGLAFGRDGVLYGVAGAAPGYAHLFRYDAARGFVDLGNPRFEMKEPGIEQGILWRGFQIGTVAASEDGRYIVLGEEEALSQLMVFEVGGASYAK